MALMEPRESEDVLSLACLARRCSSSWSLVAPRHRWHLWPRELMGIGHVNGVLAGAGVYMAPMALVPAGEGDRTLVATRACVGSV
jgi:hypothetical protein